MKRLLGGLVMGVAALMMNVAQAQEVHGTPKQALAMVKKAIAHVKEVGKEKAFADFGDAGNTDFHKGDLYVSVYDFKGVLLAHGNNPRIVGKNLYELKDLDGKLFLKDIVETAKLPKGSGWVDYKWPNPVTKAVEAKTAYFERSGDIILATGFYKQQ